MLTDTQGNLLCEFCVEFEEHELCVVCEVEGVARFGAAGAYVDGYCYLSLFKDNCQGVVAKSLGAWPRLLDVLLLHESWFRSVQVLKWFSLEGTGSLRHLVELDTPSGSSVMECASAYVSAGFSVPYGSFLFAVVDYWGLQEFDASFSHCFGMRLGGSSYDRFLSRFGLLPLVNWSIDDVESRRCYRAYMEAYVAYASDGVVVEQPRCLLGARRVVGVEFARCVDGSAASGVDVDVLGASGLCGESARDLPSESPGGDVDEVLGKNTLRNRQWRKERKDRKHRKQGKGFSRSSLGGRFVASGCGFFDECSEETRRALRETRAERLSVQNRLEAAKAARQLELLGASDVELEKKRYSTQVRAQTEKNMAVIERTHAFLSSTGNVPGEGILSHDHDVHTVVGSVPGSTNLSGSISPNSSASQAEFLACQKKLFDAEKLNKDMLAAFKKLGISYEAAGALDKQTFTDTPENAMLVDELYPDDHGVIHYVQRGGQRKFKVGPDDYYEG